MDSLCRVCVKKAPKWTSLNTKIENTLSLSFFEFLNKYISLNACETDKLPQSLCSICTHSIKTFYSFVKLAEKSNTILREALENSIATGTHYDNGGIWDEIIIRNEKIEEESADFDKEDSFHCPTRENSTGSSLYILDIVKEEPRVSESTSTSDFKDVEINESEKFPSNLYHPEGSVEETGGALSCVDADLACIDVEHSDSEDDVPISFLKRRLIIIKDETDSQSNFLSEPHCINSNLEEIAGKIQVKSEEVIKDEDSKDGSRKQVSSEADEDLLKTHIRGHTENTYKCLKCDMVFNDREEFRTHCLSHIYGDKHKCNICGKMFARRRYLNKHLVIHEEKKKYECSICGKKFAGQQYLYNHLVSHDKEKKCKCSICGKGFKHFTTRWRHMKIHSGEKPFECEICGKKFRLKDGYNAHLLVHTRPHKLAVKKYDCKVCSKKFSSKRSLNFHMEDHNGITKKCDHCNKKFTNNLALSEHMKGHFEPKTFKCEKCSKEFSSKYYLNIHLENHEGIIKKCDQCDKEFNNSLSLRNHMKWHTEPKPFKCVNCGKSFTKKNSLIRHMVIFKHAGNSNEETYRKGHTEDLVCKICNKQFWSIHYLNVHMENHNGNTKKCDQCDKEFQHSKTLRDHMKWHINPRPFKCEKCSKTFSSKCYLNIHMENHKGITKKCDKCDKEFKNSKTLSDHMKWHINPRPFKCEKCNKQFSSKRYLNVHMENHKGIIKKCDQCDKEFNNSLTLRKHMKWHINPKPFKCVNCAKSFSRKDSHTKHMNICKPVGNSNEKTETIE